MWGFLWAVIFHRVKIYRVSQLGINRCLTVWTTLSQGPGQRFAAECQSGRKYRDIHKVILIIPNGPNISFHPGRKYRERLRYWYEHGIGPSIVTVRASQKYQHIPATGATPHVATTDCSHLCLAISPALLQATGTIEGPLLYQTILTIPTTTVVVPHGVSVSARG